MTTAMTYVTSVNKIILAINYRFFEIYFTILNHLKI
jgi:hypothetical protein